MGETIKTWTLRFPAKENPNVAKALLALLANRVTIVRQGEVSVDFGHEVFPHERWLNKPKATRARLYPFDKPIKSLHFRLIVVSVLFARFHFKVIRKSLYQKKVRPPLPGANARPCSYCLALTELASQRMTLKA